MRDADRANREAADLMASGQDEGVYGEYWEVDGGGQGEDVGLGSEFESCGGEEGELDLSWGGGGWGEALKLRLRVRNRYTLLYNIPYLPTGTDAFQDLMLNTLVELKEVLSACGRR